MFRFCREDGDPVKKPEIIGIFEIGLQPFFKAPKQVSNHFFGFQKPGKP